MITVTPPSSAIRAPSSLITPNWHHRVPAWIATVSARYPAAHPASEDVHHVHRFGYIQRARVALLPEDLRLGGFTVIAVAVPPEVVADEVAGPKLVVRQAHDRDRAGGNQHALDRQRRGTAPGRSRSRRLPADARRRGDERETLLQVPDQVLDRFGADRQSHRPRPDACRPAARRHPAGGASCGGVDDQALRVADVRQVRPEGHAPLGTRPRPGCRRSRIVALGALGIDLAKVTILAGAFTVGIGFGLQNVINNFVSGVILLFERPIKVGDVIEVGGIVGEVSRIGIRASVIRTADGSEVIVPNGSLISSQVTNWTFSDRKRAVEISVNVAGGADHQRVVEVLKATAASHPGVAKEPLPQVYVVNFSSGAVTFQLRVWTDPNEEWAQLRSDLSVAVNDALAREKIALA